MNARSLETNRRTYRPRAIAKEITLQETQGLKTFVMVVLAMGVTISALGYMISTQRKINVLESENVALTQKIRTSHGEIRGLNAKHIETEAEYNSTINVLKANINDLQSNIASSTEVIDALNEELIVLLGDNKDLAKQYDEVLAEYNVLSSREELFDKYEYVLKYNGNRTDVTYDQVKLAEELMLDKGYDPDILFSIIMVESKGVEKAQSSRSTAAGLGQFLSGTGKYTYETLMGNGKGTYNHSMAKNGTTNIKMMTAYLDYLFQKTDNDLFKSIKRYSGGNDTFVHKYISWMRGYTTITRVGA